MAEKINPLRFTQNLQTRRDVCVRKERKKHETKDGDNLQEEDKERQESGCKIQTRTQVSVLTLKQVLVAKTERIN